MGVQLGVYVDVRAVYVEVQLGVYVEVRAPAGLQDQSDLFLTEISRAMSINASEQQHTLD